MRTKHLEQYASRLTKPIDLTCPSDRRYLYDQLTNDLSPENLHCDGEISASEARRKEMYLVACMEQLRQLDPALEDNL